MNCFGHVILLWRLKYASFLCVSCHATSLKLFVVLFRFKSLLWHGSVFSCSGSELHFLLPFMLDLDGKKGKVSSCSCLYYYSPRSWFGFVSLCLSFLLRVVRRLLISLVNEARLLVKWSWIRFRVHFQCIFASLFFSCCAGFTFSLFWTCGLTRANSMSWWGL